MRLRLTFLGTSGSVGIPVIGCSCDVCESLDTRNKRTRPGALLELDEKKILLDVGPDFYHQALRYGIKKLDGVLLTHSHYDHIAGLDDLRVFSFLTKKPLPLLASYATYREIRNCYSYLFDQGSMAKFSVNLLDSNQEEVFFLDRTWKYLFYHQIGMQVTGYRLGKFAYLTDIKEYDASLYTKLKGVKTLVLSSLEWKPTRAHLGLDEVLQMAQKLEVEKLFITHIGHELDHEKTQKKLPSFAFLAYDGLSIECEI